MPLWILAFASLIFSLSTFARVDEPTPLCDPTRLGNNEPINTIVALQSSIIESNCPHLGRMDRLCQYIESKSKDTTPNTDFEYNYQRIVYEAACVDYVNDSDEEIARKVNNMWNSYGDSQRCGPMGVPSTGSPLRFAIHTSFNEFITEAISFWKLDLNRIENGQTMLDFLDERIERSIGTMKTNLENYRRSFIQMGAKRSSEL